MKTGAFILAILFAFHFSNPAIADVKVGDHPPLQFTDAVGNQAVDLQALSGKIVVVDFWASWCGPCMHEAPHMVELNDKYSALGVQIVGISLDADRAAMNSAITSKGFKWPQYFDGLAWENKFAKLWGVHSIPQTFIISPAGDVLWRGHPAQIDEPLEQAIKDHPPQLVDPAIAAQAGGILDKVEAATTAEKFADAIKFLAQFPPAAKADSRLAARNADDTKQLDTAAEGLLTAADSLVSDQKYSEAAAQLKSLVTSMAGTDVGKKAQASLNKLRANPAAASALAAAVREDSANAALATAQKLQAGKRDQQAYVSFKSLVKQYPGTAAAQTATDAIKNYDADPVFAKQAASADAADRTAKARSILSMAKNYLAAGKTETARTKFQDVLTNYPGTSEADTAQDELAKIPN